MNSTKKSTGNIINLVFKAVALAMAVAVVVTSMLGVMDAQGQTSCWESDYSDWQ